MNRLSIFSIGGRTRKTFIVLSVITCHLITCKKIERVNNNQSYTREVCYIQMRLYSALLKLFSIQIEVQIMQWWLNRKSRANHIFLFQTKEKRRVLSDRFLYINYWFVTWNNLNRGWDLQGLNQNNNNVRLTTLLNNRSARLNSYQLITKRMVMFYHANDFLCLR